MKISAKSLIKYFTRIMIGNFFVALLTGMQTYFIKYCYYLCEWDSRAKDKHYIIRNWPHGKTFSPDRKNVVQDPLVRKESIFLPPLHNKLGLIKQFVKVMDKAGEGFSFFKNKFPFLNEAEIKKGILMAL